MTKATKGIKIIESMVSTIQRDMFAILNYSLQVIHVIFFLAKKVNYKDSSFLLFNTSRPDSINLSLKKSVKKS